MEITLQEVNELEESAFIALLGGIFEQSPWVAAAVYPQRPFRSVQELHANMLEAVAASGEERTQGLILAHPDLATRLKVDGYSAKEQRGAGLDSLSPEEYERFQALNARYKNKFGFPFILAVTGKTKEQIAAAMEERIHHDPETERAAALNQIARIAEIRLNQLFAG